MVLSVCAEPLLLRVGERVQERSDYLFQFLICLLRDLALLSDGVQQRLVGGTEMLEEGTLKAGDLRRI